MKKIVALLLALVMLFALFGCGADEAESQTDATTEKNEFDDAIIIDGIKLEYIQGASKGDLPYVKLKFKMTNNYMPADGQTYADRIVYDIQVLDADGVITDKLICLYEGLAYGETAWVEKSEGLDLDSISAFCVKDYKLYAMEGTNSTLLGAGKLSEPAVFYVEEIEITQ